MGDGCEDYKKAAAAWCPVAATYAVAEWRDATAACCACGGGHRAQAPSGAACHSDMVWRDALGAGCEQYDGVDGDADLQAGGDLCMQASGRGIWLNTTAADKCCACGGGVRVGADAAPPRPETLDGSGSSMSDAGKGEGAVEGGQTLSESALLNGVSGVPNPGRGNPGRAYREWKGSREIPAKVDVSGGLLISPRDYARFLRALLPTVEVSCLGVFVVWGHFCRVHLSVSFSPSSLCVWWDITPREQTSYLNP